VAQPIYYPLLLHARAALAAAADVHVDGPVVSPPTDGHSRWPHRIADLGPFSLVDAAATMSDDRRKLALTLVNRSPDQPETVDIVVRDLAFRGSAQIRCLTGERGRDARALPDVEAVSLEEGSAEADGPRLTLTLPAQSFTVIESAMAAE
jgi:alpha-L-arabinofuranosidase